MQFCILRWRIRFSITIWFAPYDVMGWKQSIKMILYSTVTKKWTATKTRWNSGRCGWCYRCDWLVIQWEILLVCQAKRWVYRGWPVGDSVGVPGGTVGDPVGEAGLTFGDCVPGLTVIQSNMIRKREELGAAIMILQISRGFQRRQKYWYTLGCTMQISELVVRDNSKECS